MSRFFTEFVIRVRLPYGFRKEWFVSLFNVGIRRLADANKIELGSALDWEVTVHERQIEVED